MKQKHWIFLVVGGYFLTRLVNLTILPVFNDEAIYTEWGMRMLQSGNYFYSLYDGKQPLLMWFFGILANIFSNPLFGARLVSVFAGLVALLGIYFLAKDFFSKKTALIATLIYVISPLFLFFDRQALMESAVSAAGIWTLYFLLKYLKNNNPADLIYIAVMWSIGLYLKNSYFIFMGLSLLMLVFVKKKELLKHKQEIGMALFAFVIFVAPLVLQRNFLNIVSMNQRYTFGLGELAEFPFESWFNNANTTLQVFLLTSFGLFVIFIFLSLTKIKAYGLFGKILLVSFFSGVLIYIFFSKSANPRYVVSFLPTGAIIIADFIYVNFKKNRQLICFGAFVTLVWFVFLDFNLIFKPLNYFDTLAKISSVSQKGEYVTNWTSGYATEYAISYLKKEIGTKPAIVGVRLDSGNPESAALMYFGKQKNIQAVYLDERTVELPEGDAIKSEIPIYFVARDKNLAGLNRFLIEKKSFSNPGGEHNVNVYEVRRN